MDERHAGSSKPSQWRRLCVLYGLVLLGLAIQIAGVLLTDQNWVPIFKPNAGLKLIGVVGLVITTLAPVFSLFGLNLLRKQTPRIATPAMRVCIWTGAIVLVVVSFGEFLWSCSGHPTWFMAFA
jgi:hypothetical protein